MPLAMSSVLLLEFLEFRKVLLLFGTKETGLVQSVCTNLPGLSWYVLVRYRSEG